MQANDSSGGTHGQAVERDGPQQYEIRCAGHLDPRWAAWFDGLSLSNQRDGTTTISGPVVDQAALYGLLSRLRDVGVALVSVKPIHPAPAMPDPP